MKKLIVLLVVALGIAAYAAQDTTLTNREVRDPIQLEAWLETTAANIATLEARVPQTDTNVTTTTTGYTPVYVGQILIGGKGTGTNGVWIAKGVTTNDWVQVAP